MTNHDFTLVNADTDSISFCKPDQTEFTEEEQENLLQELNSLFPEKIKFESEGIFSHVIVLKAKNYVLKKAGEKPKYKGSAIKATTKEPRLQDFIKDIIKEIGLGRGDYLKVYNQYVKEIMNIKDINGWCTKKTITDKVQLNERTNEKKVRDIIQGTEYREGDKIYCYFKSDKSLGLRENFNGDYCKDTLLKKLYATVKIFDKIIDISIFSNYSLKKNKVKLEEFLNA